MNLKNTRRFAVLCALLLTPVMDAGVAWAQKDSRGSGSSKQDRSSGDQVDKSRGGHSGGTSKSGGRSDDSGKSGRKSRR